MILVTFVLERHIHHGSNHFGPAAGPGRPGSHAEG
jgi:hypothetical protein